MGFLLIEGEDFTSSLVSREWRPPGYIFFYEFTKLIGIHPSKAYWQPIKPQNFPINWSAFLQKVEDLSMQSLISKADKLNDESLITLAYKLKLIKKHFPTIGPSSHDPRNDIKWLYLTNTGKFWGTVKDKEFAEKEWLKEAKPLLKSYNKYQTELLDHQLARQAWGNSLHSVRDELYKGKIEAFFYNPANGNISTITKNFWGSEISKMAFDVTKNPFGEISMPRNFIELRPRLGSYSSNTSDHGRILFLSPDIPAESGISQTKTRGRNPGDGAIDDSKYLEQMKTMIEKGKAKSPNQAAKMIADRKKDKPEGQSSPAIQDRLSRKYRHQKSQGEKGGK